MAHKTAEFDALVQKLLEEWKVPGLSIAIVQGDDIHAKSYGLSNVSGEKCIEDTIFNLASISKTTTAGAVACLVDDEKYPAVQWTTPVSQLIPDDFVMQDPEYTKNITVEDILSHRTGLPTHDASYLGIRAKHPDDAKSITRNMRNLAINKPLRTTFQYSNIMFTAATHLIEALTEQSYADFLRERIWNPLGMDHAYHDLPGIDGEEAAKKLIATPYRWDKEKEEHVAIAITPEPEGQGAGSIFCSAKEYAKWVRALLRRPSSPLSEGGWKALIEPRTIIDEEEGDEIPFYSRPIYALGLIVESYRGRKVIGHDGGVPGFTTILRYIPELNWGVVMMTNSSNAYYAIQILTHVLMDDVMGVPSDAKDNVNWETFWREKKEQSDAKDEEDENDPSWQVPDSPDPLGVTLDALAGTYYDKGYKRLVLEMKDGEVVADCNDRCFPFTLTFSHLSRSKLLIVLNDLSEAEKHKLKGEVRISAKGEVEAVAVALDEDDKDLMIWFDKII